MFVKLAIRRESGCEISQRSRVDRAEHADPSRPPNCGSHLGLCDRTLAFGVPLTRAALGLLALIVILGTPPSALAQECWKWNNELSFCPSEGGLAPAAWCDEGTLLPITPKQEAILWSRLYADTPEEALEEWASYGYPGNEGTPMLE